MYVPRSERADKIYPVKVYNKKGELTQYISWAELEARDEEDIAQEVKELKHELNVKRSLKQAIAYSRQIEYTNKNFNTVEFDMNTKGLQIVVAVLVLTVAFIGWYYHKPDTTVMDNWKFEHCTPTNKNCGKLD